MTIKEMNSNTQYQLLAEYFEEVDLQSILALLNDSDRVNLTWQDGTTEGQLNAVARKSNFLLLATPFLTKSNVNIIVSRTSNTFTS